MESRDESTASLGRALRLPIAEVMPAPLPAIENTLPVHLASERAPPSGDPFHLVPVNRETTPESALEVRVKS